MRVLRQKNRGFYRSPKLQGAAPDDVVAKKGVQLGNNSPPLGITATHQAISSR
jgi:hypothetical protein